jgi:hypothetical protein
MAIWTRPIAIYAIGRFFCAVVCFPGQIDLPVIVEHGLNGLGLRTITSQGMPSTCDVSLEANECRPCVDFGGASRTFGPRSR